MTDRARPASEITEGLRDWRDNRGDDSADALLKLVYTELHRQAHRYLQKERAGHTLQTTDRVRRGGVHSDLPLENAFTISVSETDFDLLALDEALNRLAAKEAQLAKVVELRFFSGLDVVETAEVLGLSESTIKRDWQMAKAWLHRELTR